ncbi:MAG TPA: SAM-dependent chlorinase/fluorinase [Gemmatimonadaceae bacterium]|jgi:hypothetical protein|nr:SAM-dependent chlorinase/fluorinase [Gemmatimonadaceae bacterium]
MRSIITLTTDFGTADGYVGEMKGVLLTLARDAQVVDITHDVPPQDVELARLTMARVWLRFPVGTIHVVVVDPGVGSSRKAIAVSSEGRFLVGPDNGALSPALLVPNARAVELPVDASASSTFHGRDVFAPAAAALARGESIDTLGRRLSAPTTHRTPEATRRADGAVQGVVIAIDRFGNAITNLLTQRSGRVEIGAAEILLRRTYADVGPGQLVALVGSSGLIELAIRDGNAAVALGLTRGATVVFHPAD